MRGQDGILSLGSQRLVISRLIALRRIALSSHSATLFILSIGEDCVAAVSVWLLLIFKLSILRYNYLIVEEFFFKIFWQLERLARSLLKRCVLCNVTPHTETGSNSIVKHNLLHSSLLFGAGRCLRFIFNNNRPIWPHSRDGIIHATTIITLTYLVSIDTATAFFRGAVGTRSDIVLTMGLLLDASKLARLPAGAQLALNCSVVVGCTLRHGRIKTWIRLIIPRPEILAHLWLSTCFSALGLLFRILLLHSPILLGNYGVFSLCVLNRLLNDLGEV